MTGRPVSVEEEAARARKAVHLVAALEEHLSRIAGRDVAFLGADAALAAAIADAASDGFWRGLAEVEGIRPPSARTVEVVRTILRARARDVAAAPDPFDGLP